MAASKFIPTEPAKFTPPKSVSIQYAEEKALEHYQERIVKCGQDLEKISVSKYHFNRAFEYGIQWALDNSEWLEEYKEYSHYGHHHPLNYEKLFDPNGKPRSDE